MLAGSIELFNLSFFFSCKIYRAAEGINTEFITLPRKYEHGEGKERLRLSCPTAGRGWAPTAAAARHWGGRGAQRGLPNAASAPVGKGQGRCGAVLAQQLKADGSSAPGGTRQKQSSLQLSFPPAELRAAGRKRWERWGPVGSGGRQRSAQRNFCSLEERFAEGGDLRELIETKSSSTGPGGGGGGEIMGGWCPRWSSAPPALLSPHHRGDGGTTARWSEIWKGAELHVPAERGPRKRGFRAAALKRCP